MKFNPKYSISDQSVSVFDNGLARNRQQTKSEPMMAKFTDPYVRHLASMHSPYGYT